MLDLSTQDGTADSAAAAIAQIPKADAYQASLDETPAGPARDREADGKFKKPGETVEDADKSVEAKPDAAEAEDDEDYLEYEVEPEAEGAEAKRERVKLSEALDGYRKSKTLEAELAEARKSQPLPEEYEQQLVAVVQERAQYANALERWAHFNQPKAPDKELLNPYGNNHDPEAYYAQLQAFEKAVADQKSVAAEIERTRAINQQQEDTLAKSRLVREQAALAKVWPEIVKDKAVLEKTIAGLKQNYGLDDRTLKSVSDHRFYALAKDALAFRAAQTAKQEAVKVVRDKPKLVRAAARNTLDSKAASFANSFGDLQKSGSVADAARAIAALR